MVSQRSTFVLPRVVMVSINYDDFTKDKINLALIQWKNLAFSASFGKAAGIGFIKNAQVIRFK